MDKKLLKHGMISWSELLTTDLEKAKKFYGELLGWKWTDMPDMNYSVFEAQGMQIGGAMKITPEMKGMPPNWGLYASVDDVDAAAKKAASLGATIIVPPTDIPEVGRFCTLRDPQGATISLIHYVG